MRRIFNNGSTEPTVALESLPDLLDGFDTVIAALEAECLRIDEAVEVADTLTELAAAAGDGPLSSQTAGVLQIATESLLARVGDPQPTLALEKNDLVVHGEIKQLEPQAPPDTRTVGRKILDKVKEIWRAIVEAFKRVFAWVTGLYRRFYDIAGQIKAHAEGARKRLHTLQTAGATTEFNKFSHPANATIRSVFRFDKHFTTNPVRDAIATKQAIARQFSRFGAEDLYNGKFFELIKSGKYDEIHYDPAQQKSANGLVKEVAHRHATVTTALWQSEPLLGGEWIHQEVAHKPCSGAEAVRQLRNTPYLSHGEEEKAPAHADIYGQPRGLFSFNLFPEFDQAPTVNLGPALQLCEEEAIAIADSVLHFRDVQRKLEHLGDRMRSYAEQKLKGDGDDPELHNTDHQPAVLETVRREFMLLGPKIFAKEPAQMVQYALRIAGGLGAYCSEIARVFEGKDYQRASPS
jgi:hypothetical protein